MKKKLNPKQTKRSKSRIAQLALCIIAVLIGGLLGYIVIQDQNQFSKKVQTYKPGNTYSNRDYDVRIDAISRGSGEKGSLNPGEGKTYLIVTLYVKNKSNKSLPLYPVTQTYIKDSQGQTYSIGPAIVKQPFLAGDLSAGDQVKGELAYEIPDNLANPLFYFEGLSNRPLVIKL